MTAKQFFKMTDKEYWDWCRTLSDEQYERQCNRRYKAVEYEVRTIDQYGDCIEVQHHDTEAEARATFDATELDEQVRAVAIEKAEKYYDGSPDRDLHDADYTVLARRGDAEALAAGGWDCE